MHARDLIAAVALVGALAGCNGIGSGDPVGQGADAAGTEDLDCQGASLSTRVIESAPLASTLPESARQAFGALTGVKDVATYRVLDDKDGHLTIGGSLSERDAATLGLGSGPINFRMATIQSSASGGDSAYGWWYVANTACELQRTFKGLAAADVWLNPAFPAPRTGDTAVHLLVTERACAGGGPAGKRIKVAELVRDAAQVRIAVAIKPQPGSFTCPGNPREPVTVDLGSPLGDQPIVNSTAYPARAFAPPEGSGSS
jgi:hypothetical protein